MKLDSSVGTEGIRRTVGKARGWSGQDRSRCNRSAQNSSDDLKEEEGKGASSELHRYDILNEIIPKRASNLA